jgi:hypothetical protein
MNELRPYEYPPWSPYKTLKSEEIRSFETSLKIYQSTRRNNPKVLNHGQNWWEKIPSLKSCNLAVDVAIPGVGECSNRQFVLRNCVVTRVTNSFIHCQIMCTLYAGVRVFRVLLARISMPLHELVYQIPRRSKDWYWKQDVKVLGGTTGWDIISDSLLCHISLANYWITVNTG